MPGTALYTVFEVQGYASMLMGGALSFNLVFPSNEPDIWRLMGMWSIWMFSKIFCFCESFILSKSLICCTYILKRICGTYCCSVSKYFVAPISSKDYDLYIHANLKYLK